MGHGKRAPRRDIAVHPPDERRHCVINPSLNFSWSWTQSSERRERSRVEGISSPARPLRTKSKGDIVPRQQAAF
jgi:hypothetical protein